MFKLRYNLLALIQISILFANAVILIRVFGASVQSDAYLMGTSIIDTLGLVQLMLVEQFMYFYHDLKIKDEKEAHAFYNASIVLSIISGIIFVIILFFGINFLIKLFAFGLDPERASILKNVLIILIFGLIFSSANYVNQRLLNAEMKFSIPYIIDIMSPFVILISLCYMIIFNQKNIELLAYARVLGISTAFTCGILLIDRTGIRFKPKLSHPMMKKFIINSFTMRFGHNIHNILFTPITSNILSTLPAGYASCFYYAQMIINVINSITVGPSNKVLYSKVSENWSAGKTKKISGIMKNYLKNTVPIFILALLISYFLIPYVLNIITSGGLAINDVELIKSIFLGLSIWYAIIMVESAFVSVGVASKNSKIFIFTNSVFILIFFSISITFKNQLGVMVIPLAAIIGQTVNFFFYSRFTLKLLGIKNISRKIHPINIFRRIHP